MLPLIDKYKPYLMRLTDVRIVGQIIFVVIVLLITWSGIKVIHTNYTLQQQIARLQQENANQQLKNQNQKLQNEYYNSPQYLELSARQNFGLAAPGEKELLVPKDVALAHVPKLSTDAAASASSNVHQMFFQRNMQAWLDFFLHRDTAGS